MTGSEKPSVKRDERLARWLDGEPWIHVWSFGATAYGDPSAMRADVGDLRAERDAFRADLAAAAGELCIDMPQPGSDLSRLMSANVLLRRENERLRADLARAYRGIDEALAAAFPKHPAPPDAERLDWLATYQDNVVAVRSGAWTTLRTPGEVFTDYRRAVDAAMRAESEATDDR